MYREDQKLELRESMEDDTDGIEPNFDEDEELAVTDSDFAGMSLEDEEGEIIDDEDTLDEDFIDVDEDEV